LSDKELSMAEAFICDFIQTPIGRYGEALVSFGPMIWPPSLH
jgi:hypothetical protein